ncbi:MAG: DUF5518 domain-containing protein [Halobacteriaceae archaeon]
MTANDDVTATAGADAADGADGSSPDRPTVPAYVDWLVGAGLGAAGLLLLAGGVALTLSADRDAIADAVAAGTVRSDVFTGAELVEVTYSVALWGGVGLAVAGLGCLGVGVAYVALRSRARRTATPRGVASDALVGAVVSGALAFLPFSPIAGGAVAGYLRGETGGSVSAGGLSGALAVLPVVVVLGFLVGGLVVGAPGVTGARVDAVAAVLLLVAVVFTVAVAAALGGLGGYVGGKLFASRR